MIRRLIVAVLFRTRCDRAVLAPMLDKLTAREMEALFRLLKNLEDG